MDVDMEDASSTRPARRSAAAAEETSNFDLDGYISNYTGRTATDRLIHIVQTVPSAAGGGRDAVKLGLQHIYRSRDPTLYQALLNACPQGREPPALDTKWAEETMSKNQAERTKLEAELKTYSNNMIKESIRMAHRDLGDFHRATGDYASALKHYTKSREFCTTSQHVLEMCMAVLELLIEQRNYQHIPTYVFKADAALDAAATATAGEASAGPNTGAGKKVAIERERVQSKLDFATALSHLGQGNFERAAYYFTRLGSARDLGDWVGRVVAPGDIAIYGTICAVASLTRAAFKSQVQESTTFSVYIEQEPYVRELIEAYLGSNFKSVLDVLARYKTRHLVDIHLHLHVNELMNLIRSKAVVLYFQPFSSIKLERMSAAFGWTVDEVERHVVALIQSGDIQGRIDSQNKVLQVKKTDYRADLFARAIHTGQDIQATNRKLLLRMRLQQADLVIKAPKGSEREQRGGSGQNAPPELIHD